MRILGPLLALTYLVIIATLTLIGTLPFIVISVISVTSMITLILYFRDKQAAINHGRRTSEFTLQVLALAGGWPGAVYAQQWFRHKSSKSRFQFFFWLCVFINILLLFWLIKTTD
jgi:uncharacterized membrane protein YsdA (DUF1294 family)